MKSAQIWGWKLDSFPGWIYLLPVLLAVADWKPNWWFQRIVLVVLSFSHVQLFVTPWTAAHQASLSFTISQSLLKLMSIELVMASSHRILYHPLFFLPSIFPSIRVFSSEKSFPSGRLKASASVLPVNIQGLFPLGLTGWISLQSRGLSGVFSSTTIWKHQFFGTQPSLWSNSHTCT